IEQLQAILNPRAAIWNFREIVLAKLLLVCKTERTMVSRYHLQIVGSKSIPKLWLILLLPQGWSKNVLRLFKTCSRHLVFDREQKVLRARLRKCRNSTVTCLPNLIQRILARQ